MSRALNTQIAGVVRYAVVNRRVSCDLCGDGVLLKAGNGMNYGLNHVGALIWNLLQQSPRTLEEMKSEVLARYRADPDRVESDILDLLAGLAAANLIEKQA